jgi:hypothetical protein
MVSGPHGEAELIGGRPDRTLSVVLEQRLNGHGRLQSGGERGHGRGDVEPEARLVFGAGRSASYCVLAARVSSTSRSGSLAGTPAVHLIATRT